MKKITWNTIYKVGINDISQKQMKISSILDELSSIKELKETENLKVKTHSLIDYTKTLFTEEEKIMERIGYNDYEIHKTSHHFFLKQLEEFNNDIGTENEYFLFNTIFFLKNWFLNHILKNDKKAFKKTENNLGKIKYDS